ncbi:pantoate--beta-alanine ligase [Oceanobacter sp. 4_MG-2023]|jgi:pantoate--beta-alanine ligase|nr:MULTISPECIES: pantoate--beta-alanine ligase [unclassified Oceanobacter]MDO6683161.1 pantoate--beta-alanine ligase [Oceanobacter sp. 5_MG-2023]MDP2549084.1 pantoate--beta-alanine ligase [Oceanobacter sp. 4_MG-2023]MDP2609493.1 pantoate--beta-alanine ligase [Oceanobacter sp. 1_MG-2023]MDP2612807.1 pantoate--beta-alanine ligase [Oceanobacter sp. 2_MG-2023]
MMTVHTVSELRQQLRAAKAAGHDIGLVPTMGNLHRGHISLIDAARQRNCFVVASIFVNPLQFNDPSDLERYPRTLEADSQQLADAGCHLVFAPSVAEMYPHGQSIQTHVHVPGVSAGLCGGSRPGHFDGVATVISKLFNMVQPDLAFFGEKDFQQVAVIRKMVEDLNIPVSLVPVPTARASDGLALSSRNGYLTDAERQAAPQLYRTLTRIAQGLQAGEALPGLLQQADHDLQQQGFIRDYIEVRDADTLAELDTSELAKATRIVILAAASLGKARLIDNILVSLNTDFD